MRRSAALAVLPLVLGAALAACGPVEPNVEVTSPDDVLRLSKRLVFSTVDEEARPAKTVTVRNTGGADLQVTSLAVSGPFALAAGQDTAFPVPAGGSAPVAVVYAPPTTLTATTIHTGSLTIETDDPDTPSTAVTLKGLDSAAYEDVGEPTLRVIANALGYNGADVIGTVQRARWPIAGTTEVISPYWRRADAGAPVQLVPLARYAARTSGPTGGAGWYRKGTDPNVATNRRQLYDFAGCGCADPTVGSGGENQRLLPAYQGATTAFDPTASNPAGLFGLFADSGRSFSDDGYHKYVEAETGTTVESQTHNFRFFPARTAGGATIPNAWLAGVDISTIPMSPKNYDYQDYVFLLVNATPELTPAARPSLPALEFTGAVDGTVVDRDDEGTGFTSVQSNDAGTQHQPGLLDLDTGAGVLRITTTNGSNSGGTDAQANAVQRVFDGSYRRWDINTTLLDPAAPMTTNLQHQAVFFGPDNGNFVKLEVEYRDGAARLVSYAEKNGAFVFADTTGPTIAPGSTVELHLLGDPDLRTVQPAYRINGGTLTTFGAAYAPSDSMRWFSVQAQGGILASSQLGQGVTTSPSFVATFDRASISFRT